MLPWAERHAMPSSQPSAKGKYLRDLLPPATLQADCWKPGSCGWAVYSFTSPAAQYNLDFTYGNEDNERRFLGKSLSCASL